MILTKLLPVVITFFVVIVFACLFIILIKYYASNCIKEVEKGDRDEEFLKNLEYNKQEKVIKRKKTMKVVRNVLFYVFLTIIVPFFVFSLINRIQKNTTMIGNRAMMVVASGSMSFKNEKNDYLLGEDDRFNYQFNRGDIIILEKVKSIDDIEKYDVICYYNPQQKMNVIHRVIEVKSNNAYVTRGDANDASDNFEPSLTDVVGLYNGKALRGVGLFVLFLQSYAGIITVICLLVCIFTFDYFNKQIKNAQDKRCKLLDIITSADLNELQKSNKDIKYTINYKGNSYYFDEDGNFIKLEEINQENLSKGV